MTLIKFFSLLIVLTFAQISQADLALNVKINKTIGEKTIQMIKKIRANFNQEIVLSQDDTKEKIVLKFKKFNNISVNGNKINPIQVDMKTIGQDKKQIGKIKTVTSFYQREAIFAGENSTGNWQVNLKFEEI